MPRRSRPAHRVRDVAEQAGVSEATVDRVLHGRPHVSPRAVRQVEQALLDLDRQQAQLRLGARSLMIDVVMQAPGRFTTAVRTALESELPRLRPATVRARFHLRESGTQDDLGAVLDRIGTRGRTCQGVILKAPDVPVVAAAIERLGRRGVPVVTFVTDVRESRRAAYVGLDNDSAGRTAALLLAAWTADAPGVVLVTLSRRAFFGERERGDAFRHALADLAPGREVIELADADGLDATMHALVARLRRRDVVGVYSIGGGNRGIVAALAEVGVRPRVYVAHDLDADNEELLRTGRIDLVLHHDLRADVRRACEQLLRAHDLLPGAPTSWPAPVEVITRHNIPPRLGARLS